MQSQTPSDWLDNKFIIYSEYRSGVIFTAFLLASGMDWHKN